MSEPAPPARPFYVTGGTLKPGEPSYVERRADAELYESILAGEFCYILTARQMGKSSLMARTAKRLEQAGVASAIVDLTQIGSERGDQAAAQWYFGIANVIHRQLGITAPLRSWWQERADVSSIQRLTDFFRELVLTNLPGRVVIFVDEIDSTIGLPFAADFFAALRACFNVRATDDAFERLTFVLLGVATPDQLIRDPARTPFNIGKRVDLTDFRSDEAQVLAPGLHADPAEAGRRLDRVLHWTGGHPYLTQAVCRSVREKGDTGTAEEAVDPQVGELFLSSRAQREETNLKHARARLEKRGPEGRRLLQLYRRVRQGKLVSDQPTSSLFGQLKLAGVVKSTDEGRLAVRNLIYETVFTPEWAKAAMPADRGRQLAAATLAAAFVSVLVWYTEFQPRPYEEALRSAMMDDGYNTAIEAYTNLRANPFSRSRATELMQQFWEQRALRYALDGKRDESLLCYLKGIELKDSERLRRQARNLVGSDYEKLRLTLRHPDELRAIALSPNGQILATASLNIARLWDAISGNSLAPPLRHNGPVRALAFSPDGQTIATGAEDRTARLWDVHSGKLLLSFPLQAEEPVNAVAFSPNGQMLATGSGIWGGRDRAGRGGTARLWSARSGKPLTRPLEHEDSVNVLAFSPDSRALATGSGSFGPGSGVRSGATRLWEARTGRLLAPPLPNRDVVMALAFSPDGRMLAVGSFANITFWDARTGRPFASPVQHAGIASSALSWPKDRTFAVWTLGNSPARLWYAQTGKPPALSLQTLESVTAMAFTPEGQTFATRSSMDGTVRVWDTQAKSTLTPTFRHESVGDFVAFSPDGRAFATGFREKTVRLWDADTFKPLAPPLHIQDPVIAMAFSPDGQMFATGSEDSTARLWDVHTGKSLVAPLQHEYPADAVAFSPDGSTFATGSFDNTVRLWDARTGKLLTLPLEHRWSVEAVAFSPDGGTLATGSMDNTARLWDARTGKPLTPPLEHKRPVDVVTFSPDGETLATGSWDNTARLWDAHTGKPLGPPLRNQTESSGEVRRRTIAFSPSGEGFFVARDHWLNTYSWDGKRAVPQSSQLLHGLWKRGFRFSSDCGRCIEVALGDTSNSFYLETLRLDGPTDPPIEGDPRELLEKWQARLGLKFDEQMKPVPR